MLAKILITPLFFLHESAHYILAIILGVEARFSLTQVELYFDHEDDWRRGPILIAPALLGTIVCAALAVWGYTSQNYRYIIDGIIVWTGWQLTCLNDLYKIFFRLRQGYWPKPEDVPDFERWFRFDTKTKI